MSFLLHHSTLLAVLTYCETGHFKLCSPFRYSVLKCFNSTTECLAFLLMLKSCSLSSACLFKWASWEIHHTFFLSSINGEDRRYNSINETNTTTFTAHILRGLELIVNFVFLPEAAASCLKKLLENQRNRVSVVILTTHVILCLETMLIRSVIWLWRDMLTILLLFFIETWTVEWWND